MSYFNEMVKAMNYLSKKKDTIFIGQATKYPGTIMSKTLVNIDKKKIIEFPVAEEMQMGASLGLSLQGKFPISIYPRLNFLLLAINQLVNHIDKFKIMTDGYYKNNFIIRTSIGSERPLHPHVQHIGDMSKSIKLLCPNINVIVLKEPNQIFDAFKNAYKNIENKGTILIEYGDYFNEK